MKRFWDKVNIRKTNECWEWTAARQIGGYGAFSTGGRKNKKQYNASRFAYILENGDPGNLFVLHKCDNPSCCNPRHLYAGTQKQNVHDMHKRGRAINNQPKGENHNKAKLTESQVKKIRKQYASGKFIQEQLAKRYGVGQDTISSITMKKTWRHI